MDLRVLRNQNYVPPEGREPVYEQPFMQIHVLPAKTEEPYAVPTFAESEDDEDATYDMASSGYAEEEDGGDVLYDLATVPARGEEEEEAARYDTASAAPGEGYLDIVP